MEVLIAEFKSKGIKYAFDPEGYEQVIEGTKDDPSHYKVELTIGECLLTVRNFNGWLIRKSTAEGIVQALEGKFKTEIISTGAPRFSPAPYKLEKDMPYIYGGRETRFCDYGQVTRKDYLTPAEEKPKEKITVPERLPERLDNKNGKWIQGSLF